MTFNETLGLIMLFCMVSVIFVGFSISFTLLFIAIVFGAIGLGVDRTFYLTYLQVWGSMKDDIVPAVPMFIFMGYMCEQAGLMDRLFATFRQLFAPLRGSLYLAVLLTATLFAMATGIVGAAVSVLGIMAGGMMVRAGYDSQMSAGAIAAGGTLGILIPPSVMLLVMGPVLGVPVNKLYAAAFGPGFLLAALYIAYCLIRSFINPKLGPPLPKEERMGYNFKLFKEVVISILPLLLLIGSTLGTILTGLATATEAAACGALGSMILSAFYGKLTLTAIKGTARSTLLTSAMVLLLVMASNIFGAVFVQLGSASLIETLLNDLPLPGMGKFLLVMFIVFLLGWPFEWPVIILVFVPIFIPVIQKLDVGLSKGELMLWFGATLAVNLQTAFLSPPVAMSAYYLKTVMPSWNLALIFRGMAQFMVIQVVALAMIIGFPSISLWLPRLLYQN
ncbi:MAG: sialic acid transporter permease protein SiaT [Pseudomonadota bacterium]